MPLIIIEGNRNAGKTHLISNQNVYPVFKFDFNKYFLGLNLEKESISTHQFGIGKEIMLHDLYNTGIISEDVVIDRGIITNMVWGVLKGRIDLYSTERQLTFLAESGLFKNSRFIIVRGIYNQKRNKDIWDDMDVYHKEEEELFIHFSELLKSFNVEIDIIMNSFDNESKKEFINLLERK